MAQEKLKNLVGIIIFYAIIILGVIALNNTMNNMNSTNTNYNISIK